MRIKNLVITLVITFILSFLLQGINDPNTFVFSEWRQNNIVNLIHLWLTFLTAYYLFSFIVEIGFKKYNIDTSKKLIGLLVFAQLATFLWVILTDIFFYIVYYKITSLSETTFFEFDVPLATVILTIGSVYFYQKNYLKSINSDAPEISSQTPREKNLEVFKGTKNLFVSHSEIGIIHLSNKIVWVTTLQNESFLTNFSLSELTEELSSSMFFRLNRQVIVSRKIVKGYSRLDYQKLAVMIDGNSPLDINLVISKYNAPTFKKWLTNSI